MIPINLPEIYARVVAKRSDLSVTDATLYWHGEIDGDGYPRDPRDIGWFIGDDGFDATLCGGPNAAIAAALIFDVWFKALPAGIRLYMTDGDIGGMPGPRRWIVEDHYEDEHWGIYESPLEALAAYWLNEKKR
jgi:hypothetical protein